MQSIISYSDRGQGESSKWLGNSALQLFEDLIGQIDPKAIADHIMGSEPSRRRHESELHRFLEYLC